MLLYLQHEDCMRCLAEHVQRVDVSKEENNMRYASTSRAPDAGRSCTCLTLAQDLVQAVLVRRATERKRG
eukprot:3539-Heterococcus_DN1.PRE.3